jgi:ABC-type transport system involved in cytochrome c biogenesis permease subunit
MTLKSISLACLSLAIGFYVGSLVFFVFKKKRTTEVFFISGLLFHTISQVSRGWLIGIFTPIALFEEVFFLPWCLAFLTLCLRFFKKDSHLIYSAVIPILLFLLVALLYPKGVFHPSPQVQTVFSPLFFFFEVLAHACFCMGAWFSLLYLQGKENARIFHSFVIWGFIFYSIAQVVGAIWCYLGWATLFNWSDRHMQSATLWCFYAAYVHLRFLPAWNMKKKAGFAITGYAFVFLLSYIGHLGEMNAVRLGG